MKADLTQISPLGRFLEHCNKGELAYQVCTDDNKAFYYPRVIAPGSGSTNLQWRISKGLGTVYATTFVHPREGTPYNVALIDMDEGFRLMSRVDTVAPHEVPFGMRVVVRIDQGTADLPPRPVFVPEGTAE